MEIPKNIQEKIHEQVAIMLLVLAECLFFGLLLWPWVDFVAKVFSLPLAGYMVSVGLTMLLWQVRQIFKGGWD